VSHRNARLTVHGRLLIVDTSTAPAAGGSWRISRRRWGGSRRCVKEWLDRYQAPPIEPNQQRLVTRQGLRLAIVVWLKSKYLRQRGGHAAG